MIPSTLGAVATAVDGVLDGGADPDLLVDGAVEFDSRRIAAGGLFVALPGERVDGHDFVGAARDAGAVAALVSRPVTELPSVVVPDPRAALGRLARAVVDRLPELAVVGITGSSGKTSTKDLLAHVLSAAGQTVAPPGSYNNEIGHPWTALRADAETRFLVLECSARGPGHIAALCEIAPPRIGVVLNVGTAHLGEFGSRAAIAASKGELVQALPADGRAVLNADDPAVAAMAGRSAAPVTWFGRGGQAGVRSEEVRLDEAGRPGFLLVTPAGEQKVGLGLYGEHHVANALAVTAVALELGLDLALVAERLESARPASRWRMEVTDRVDGVRIVNDAYNANPESMAAALRTLAAMASGRRSWAVLGEMGELGPDAAAAHAEVAALVGRLGVGRLIGVGRAASLYAAGHAALEPVADVEGAVDLLRAELRSGDVVLVKASRAVGLERIAAALLDEDPA